MDIIYGIQVEDVSNKHVVQAEAWVAGVNEVIEPGRFLVDILPFCMFSQSGFNADFFYDCGFYIVQYVPTWFPGAGFKRLLYGWRQNMYNARDGPFYEARDAYVCNSLFPSGCTGPHNFCLLLIDGWHLHSRLCGLKNTRKISKRKRS